MCLLALDLSNIEKCPTGAGLSRGRSDSHSVAGGAWRDHTSPPAADFSCIEVTSVSPLTSDHLNRRVCSS